MRTSSFRLLALSVAGFPFIGCAAERAPEGFIPVEGGKVWYHRVGDGPRTPLVLLHGGPGSCSYYLKPLLELASDRPVIIYDQLGCGKSDRITDTTLMTVDRFVRELQTVRDSLGLTEIHLLGHSWGAMLAQAYMGTSPKGVRSVILSSPLVTTAQWEADADSMLREMPDSFRTAIVDHELKGITRDSVKYRAAIRAYYNAHMWRTPAKRPIDDDSSDKAFGRNVYNYMWGPSEIRSTGTLKNFDGRPWLKMITMPTLFMAGEFDEASPHSVRRFATLVPGSQVVVIPGSGHSTVNDNPDAVIRALRQFLDSGDRK